MQEHQRRGKKYGVDRETMGSSQTLPTSAKTSSPIRAIVIAILILIPIARAHPWADYYGTVRSLDLLNVPNPTGLFVVFALMIVNLILRLLKHDRLKFGHAELLTIYSLVYVGGVTLVSLSAIAVTPTALGYYKYLAPNYRVDPYIEKGSTSPFFVQSREAIEAFYLGQSSVPWSAWIVPIIMWSIFFLVFMFVTICLVSLVRKRWSEVERLQYPLIAPVLEFTKEGKDGSPFGDFWSNRLVQLGMLIPLIYYGVNGLNSYFPIIPRIPELRLNLYNLTGWRGFTFYPDTVFVLKSPLLIGIGFLMPLQLLFSTWFFFVVWRMFLVVWIGAYGQVGLEGYTLHTLFSRIALSIALLQPFRREIMDAILLRKRKVQVSDDSNEPMSYTVAVWGAIIGTLVLIVLSTSFLQARLAWAVFFFIMSMSSILVLARFRAELGAPFNRHLSNQAHLSVFYYMPNLHRGGSAFFAGLIYHPFELGWVGNISAVVLEQYEMAGRTNMKKKHINLAVFIVMICVIAMAWYFNLTVLHKEAALMALGSDSAGISLVRIEWVLRDTANYNEPHYGAFALIAGIFGFAITYFLAMMNARFVWWPFHPAGYALATFLPVAWEIWSHLLVVWIIKAIVMRYGGANTYKKIVPFFLGLAAGSVIMVSLLGFVSIIVGR